MIFSFFPLNLVNAILLNMNKIKAKELDSNNHEDLLWIFKPPLNLLEQVSSNQDFLEWNTFKRIYIIITALSHNKQAMKPCNQTNSRTHVGGMKKNHSSSWATRRRSIFFSNLWNQGQHFLFFKRKHQEPLFFHTRTMNLVCLNPRWAAWRRTHLLHDVAPRRRTLLLLSRMNPRRDPISSLKEHHIEKRAARGGLLLHWWKPKEERRTRRDHMKSRQHKENTFLLQENIFFSFQMAVLPPPNGAPTSSNPPWMGRPKPCSYSSPKWAARGTSLGCLDGISKWGGKRMGWFYPRWGGLNVRGEAFI